MLQLRDVAELVIQQGNDEAGLFAHTDGDRHGQDEAQGSEAGEVLHHVVKEPEKSVGGYGVLDRNDLVGGGVHRGDTHIRQDAADDGDDDEKIEEHDRGDGKLVAGLLQSVQEDVEPSFLFTLCRH